MLEGILIFVGVALFVLFGRNLAMLGVGLFLLGIIGVFMRYG